MGEDLELGEIGFIVLIVGGIAYGAYKLFKSLANPDSAANKPDAQGNYGNGLAGTLLNNTLSVGTSSQSYTGALDSVITSPWDSAKSILGF